MRTIEILCSPSFAREEAVRRAGTLLGRAVEESQVTLRHAAGPIAGGDSGQRHLYAESRPGVTDVLVLREFPLLYDNAFTAAWLGWLLEDSGGGRLWIEGLGSAAPKRRPSALSAESARRRWPSAEIEQQDHWLKVEAPRGLRRDLEALDTIYSSFHNGFEAFAAQFLKAARAGAGDVATLRAAEATWKYSLFGANQKSFISEAVLDGLGVAGPRRGIDIGGGYGFFAAEMAKQGDSFDVVDRDPKKIQALGPWLAERAGLTDRLRFVLASIEDVPDLPGPGSYDVVSYFGSLLYSDHATVPATLRASMALLRPGGVLIVHENVKEGGKPGSPDYEQMFPAAELLSVLRENAGEPTCYSMFTAAPVPWEKAAQSLVMAAIVKQ